LAEAAAAQIEILDVFVEDGVAPEIPTEISHVQLWRVQSGVLSNVGSVVTSQGVAAIASIPAQTEVSADYDFVVELAAVGDPGNAGNIVRSAAAAGAQAILFGPNSVDPWNPKTLRASAGALFRVPLAEAGSAHLQLQGGRRFGADPHRGVRCDAVDLTGPVVLVVGNEAHGLDAQAASGIQSWLSVPMAPKVESLNVATATAILCYEVARQRRAAGR